MKTPSDRINEMERNLNTLTIKALSLKLALSKGEFREEDHPRADDGKFGSGSVSHKESEKKKETSESEVSEKSPESIKISSKTSNSGLPSREVKTKEEAARAIQIRLSRNWSDNIPPKDGKETVEIDGKLIIFEYKNLNNIHEAIPTKEEILKKLG